MENSKIDKEALYLLGLITFGLFVTLFIELLQLKHRPIILLIFIGISTTALFYKLLGGFNDSVFATPLFRIGGSGAFLYAFLFFVNPILERQTFPTKEEIFDPPLASWIPVDNQNLNPIDLKLKFLDFNYQSQDFGKYDSNDPLFFAVTEDVINIFKDEEKQMKLGKIDLYKIMPNIGIENTITSEKSETFLTNIQLNQSTPDRTWFPYIIRPTQFDNNTTSYDIYNKSNDEYILDKGEITLRGSNIHTLDNQTYLISVHRVNHSIEPFWVRFAVTKLGSSTDFVK